MFIKAYILASHIPVLVSVVYAAAVFKKLGPALQKFCWFLFVSGFVQLLSLALWFSHTNNMPILHVYVPLGFALLTGFYAVVLSGFVSSRILWTLLEIFIAVSIINSLCLQDIHSYNSYALTLESVLVIIYALSTFIFMLNDIFKDTRSREVRSLNLINSGLFIYYASSLAIFYCGSMLAVYSPPVLVKYAWAFHAFFAVIMYSLFIVALWKRPCEHE